ncbi:MAG: helix-turn-helix domain-containing protein [Lysobacterales bacterium]
MKQPSQHRQLAAKFGASLKRWRTMRRLSQLDLSLNANISQRHLSWLETGRSQPSRAMVLQLAEVLEVPLRSRNELLDSAGFASIYPQQGLEDDAMTSVRQALRRMLDKQLPYPGLVLDREWNVMMTNTCANALLNAVGGDDLWEASGSDEGKKNIALMTLHPAGLRPMLANWNEAANAFVQRLRADLTRSPDEPLRQKIEALIALAGDIPEADIADSPLLPMLTLDLRLGDQLLRMFSVISTFGTPQDVTTDELRIETFFPLDKISEQIFRRLCPD